MPRWEIVAVLWREFRRYPSLEPCDFRAPPSLPNPRVKCEALVVIVVAPAEEAGDARVFVVRGVGPAARGFGGVGVGASGGVRGGAAVAAVPGELRVPRPGRLLGAGVGAEVG